MASALLTLADLPPRPSTAQATPGEGLPQRSPPSSELSRPATSSNGSGQGRWHPLPPGPLAARHSSLTAATLPMHQQRKQAHAYKTSTSSLPLPGQTSPEHSPPACAVPTFPPQPAPQTMMLPLRGVGGVRQRVAIHSPSSSSGSSPVLASSHAFPTRTSMVGDKEAEWAVVQRPSGDSNTSSTRRRPPSAEGGSSLRAMSPVPGGGSLKATPTLGYSGLGESLSSIVPRQSNRPPRRTPGSASSSATASPDQPRIRSKSGPSRPAQAREVFRAFLLCLSSGCISLTECGPVFQRLRSLLQISFRLA
jgi:hypothetical protein